MFAVRCPLGMKVLPHQILKPNIEIRQLRWFDRTSVAPCRSGNKFKIRTVKTLNQQSKPLPAKAGIINLCQRYNQSPPLLLVSTTHRKICRTLLSLLRLIHRVGTLPNKFFIFLADQKEGRRLPGVLALHSISDIFVELSMVA